MTLQTRDHRWTLVTDPIARDLLRDLVEQVASLVIDGSAVIPPGSVGVDEISSAIAGNGLTGGAGSALAVQVDGSTIQATSDTLSVPNNGIGTAQLSATVQAAILGTPSFTVGTEAGNVINVAVQLKDINAVNLGASHVVMAWLSSTAGAAVTGTAPDTSAAIGTNGTIIQEIQTRKQWWVKCNTSGQFDLNLGHAAGAATWYLNLAGADGKVHSSGAITFA